MCLCFLCSDEPVDSDKYGENPNNFQVGMCKACCAEPICCVGQVICPCCAQFIVRKAALGDSLDEYECCQGYFPGCCCFKPGHLGERSCPELCLCIESCCCNSCAVSATRMYLMDKYQLSSDPWDRRIIRCNNCIQLLACVCDCLALFNENFRSLARILDCIAQIVYWTVSGCMTAQAYHEVKYQKTLIAQGEKMDHGIGPVVAQPVGVYKAPALN